MTPHDLLKHLDVIAEAPNGIARLRELVLQLAVRGKLVPQDPDEAPASARPSALEEGDQPFPIPETWWWGPLPEVAEYSVGKTPPTKEPRFWGDGDIPWVSIADMTHGETIRATSRTVTKAAAAEVFRKPPAAAGSILMSFKLTIGKTGLLGMPAYHNEAIISVSPRPVVSRDFLFRVLPVMAVFGDSKAAIKGATLNGQSLARIPVPVPPVPEQDRIVARIDELMALLDRLEAARSTREATRRALRDSSLAALRDADTPDDLESAWQRVAAHMDDLLATPEDLPPFRQTILQLAVRGRLVPPSHRDEPAAAILERVSMKRAGRPTATASRRPDPSAGSESNPPPFRSPDGWIWCHLLQICDIASGITKGRNLAGRATASFPYLRVANVQAGYLDLTVVREIEVPVDERDDYVLKEGDVLLTEGGDWDKLGRSAIWRGELPLCLHQNHVFRARSISPEDVIPEWISLFTNSPDGRRYFQSSSKQTTNLASINMTQLRGCALPVPPTSEQRRILARLDRVTGLIDQLGQRLAGMAEANEVFGAAAVTTPMCSARTSGYRLGTRVDLAVAPRSLPRMHLSGCRSFAFREPADATPPGLGASSGARVVPTPTGSEPGE